MASAKAQKLAEDLLTFELHEIAYCLKWHQNSSKVHFKTVLELTCPTSITDSLKQLFKVKYRLGKCKQCIATKLNTGMFLRNPPDVFVICVKLVDEKGNINPPAENMFPLDFDPKEYVGSEMKRK